MDCIRSNYEIKYMNYSLALTLSDAQTQAASDLFAVVSEGDLQRKNYKLHMSIYIYMYDFRDFKK